MLPQFRIAISSFICVRKCHKWDVLRLKGGHHGFSQIPHAYDSSANSSRSSDGPTESNCCSPGRAKAIATRPELYANHQGLDRKGRRTTANRKETARLPMVEGSSKRIGCVDGASRSEAD